jgi:hypothetical protein
MRTKYRTLIDQDSPLHKLLILLPNEMDVKNRWDIHRDYLVNSINGDPTIYRFESYKNWKEKDTIEVSLEEFFQLNNLDKMAYGLSFITGKKKNSVTQEEFRTKWTDKLHGSKKLSRLQELPVGFRLVDNKGVGYTFLPLADVLIKDDNPKSCKNGLKKIIKKFKL